MKKMKFLFAVLAIVFAAGSAFTPAKKKASFDKQWFKLDITAYPEDAESYIRTTPPLGSPGDDMGCPTVHSNTVCAIYATPVYDSNISDYRPLQSDLDDIVSNSSHFALELEEVLQYVEDEE